MNNDLMKIVEETKKLKAMVLEDDKETNDLMSKTLDNFFSDVQSALDGETALELYEKHQPDIIFVDIILPGKSGLDIAKEIFKILGYSAIYLKQKLEIIIVTDKIKTFTPKHFKEIEKIINYLEKLNLKKCSLTKFEFKKKGFLAIYIGDFFYKIKLNKQNKNVLLIVRKKIEENPKSLLFKSLISIDKKEKTFLNIDNLKHYLKTLKKNDKLYKSEKIKKFYENKNILNLLKETFEWEYLFY